MIWLLAVLVFAGASANAQTITFADGTANQFQIDFVTIGNPNNAPDTTGDPNPVGSVGYTYNLGKFEISRDIITKANLASGMGIDMWDMANRGGNDADKPATGISWNEAAKFVNWLNESKGYQKAYNFLTGGTFDQITPWGAGLYNGSNQFRHKDAVFFLPSRNEWYKGAYGSPTGEWFNFPTGSDTLPVSVTGGTASGTAVYNLGTTQGPAVINNAGGLSPWGTMAQGGNVWEWNESAYDLVNDSGSEDREFRGSAWDDSSNLHSRARVGANPNDSSQSVGFRVAMVPEPSSLSLLLAGGAVLMSGRRRMRP